MEDILTLLRTTGDLYFMALPVALVLLLIFLKGKRRRFVLPAILLTVAVCNPFFYKLWNKLGLYAYWRVLWLVPVIPVFAAVPGAITEKLRNIPLRLAVTALCIAAYVLCGTYIYTYTNDREIGSSWGSTFLVPAPNAEKVPQTTKEVARWLLARDENPRVVAEPEISIYLRQYSAEIDQLYGRDVEGYIYTNNSADANTVHLTLSNPDGDMGKVAAVMLNDGWEYLVVDDRDAQRREALTNVGFELETRVADYGIYTVHGTPSILKERNSLGQVIAITTLDITGNPVNNGGGYATVRYEYDINGNKTRMAYYDKDGGRAVLAAGYSMIEQEFDREGFPLVRKYLSENETPCLRKDGFSEARWEKQNGSSVRNLALYAPNGETVPLDGINLAMDAEGNNDWSEWKIPLYGVENSTFNIGCANLGEKAVGDFYTCQIEVEFSGVRATEGKQFLFRTQGEADGNWSIGNVWNYYLIHLTEIPKDGVYQFTSIVVLNENLANASMFNIGFRCDNWASGAFRVRNVKIEKGIVATAWSPGI